MIGLIIYLIGYMIAYVIMTKVAIDLKNSTPKFFRISDELTVNRRKGV